jgi:hypothetical protein
MGSGIVDTPSNFGKNGERPVHPELLDYLRQKFSIRQYSIKAMHREIMLSEAYQLSSEVTPAMKANVEKDAANRLYWRGNSTRMTAEQIRDAVLFRLRHAQHEDGRAVDSADADGGSAHDLRSRQPREERRLPAALRFPSPSQSAEKRFQTNVPLQRLFFMNSDFMQQHAESCAARHRAADRRGARFRRRTATFSGAPQRRRKSRPAWRFSRPSP